MQDFTPAINHLSAQDPVMAKVIVAHPPFSIKSHRNYYQELVDSIISQQLSVKAARTIEQRFCQLFGSDDFPAPEQILTADIEQLRSAGLSRPKASYIKDLAQHVVDGRVKFDHLDDLSNGEVIAELVAVKGIGEWTAHMFLLFCMGRLDILPTGDLGIRNGMTKLYGLDHTATPDDVRDIARENNWHPYESIASWYVWQSLDNTPSQ
jgi:DNA-3-methyladenine glycosylase II